MQWYKHYLLDYGLDTADLNFIQDAAYRRLLDAYYQREGPLPGDLKTLFRLVHASTRYEQAAVETITRRFFLSENGHLRNKRADQEIQQYQAQREANRSTSRQRIVQRTADESFPRIDREIRKKEEKPVDNSKCQHINFDLTPCGKPGTHKLHPTSKAWYCREHRDG